MLQMENLKGRGNGGRSITRIVLASGLASIMTGSANRP